MSSVKILQSELRARSLEVSSIVQSQLAAYVSELDHWNRSVNLTSLQGAALIRRLIVEPVWVGHYLQMSGVLADVGSGNGSPGIPLCVSRHFSAVHLIEPRLKRAAFLRHVTARLGLKNVTVDRNRIEEMTQRGLIADWIVLQAIDPTPDLIAALHHIGSETTRVVWITSISTPPAPFAKKLEVPDSSTIVWVFRLDQT